jgi:hypothetical protein
MHGDFHWSSEDTFNGRLAATLQNFHGKIILLLHRGPPTWKLSRENIFISWSHSRMSSILNRPRCRGHSYIRSEFSDQIQNFPISRYDKIICRHRKPCGEGVSGDREFGSKDAFAIRFMIFANTLSSGDLVRKFKNSLLTTSLGVKLLSMT